MEFSLSLLVQRHPYSEFTWLLVQMAAFNNILPTSISDSRNRHSSNNLKRLAPGSSRDKLSLSDVFLAFNSFFIITFAEGVSASFFAWLEHDL